MNDNELSSKKLIRERDIYINNFDKNEEELKETGKNFITDYEYKVANDIYNNYKYNNKVISLVVAESEIGKTGIIQALTREFIYNNDIEPANILLFTGLSSCEWLRQTENRFIEMIRPNIFHTIKKFTDFIKEKRDLLIILDEIHLIPELKNNLSIRFKECGLLDINNLIERNIKFIQISATPNTILAELYKWDRYNFNIFVIKPPDNYIGINKLLKDGKILEYKSLLSIDNVREIREIIDNKYKNNYKYHLIRIHTNQKDNKIIMDNINEVFNNETFYIKKNNINDDLNEMFLDIEPKKHTIIILKEKIKCSYTINKSYIGILYERNILSENNEMTIINGLISRACGYYDNNDILIFSNINIIKKYIQNINTNNDILLLKLFYYRKNI